MVDLSFLRSLTFTRLKITFRAAEPIILPEYKGSAFRGCLGDAFKNEVCNRKGQDCDTCLERFSCKFSKLYNSFVEGHPRYKKSPHAYIISPMPGQKTKFEPGETFWFVMTLIGSAVEMFPLLISVFGQMGETGIGKGHGKFAPVKLEYLDPELNYIEMLHFSKPEILSISKLPVPAVDNRLSLKFETPLRLKKDGKLVKTPPEFNLFTGRLLQRLSLLAHFHCGAPWSEEAVDFPFETCHDAKIFRSQLEWVKWTRFSGTQGARMNFDGHLGSIIYEGNLKQWMPLIAAGTWLHAGLTTTFGLGKFHILNDD